MITSNTIPFKRLLIYLLIVFFSRLAKFDKASLKSKLGFRDQLKSTGPKFALEEKEEVRYFMKMKFVQKKGLGNLIRRISDSDHGSNGNKFIARNFNVYFRHTRAL